MGSVFLDHLNSENFKLLVSWVMPESVILIPGIVVVVVVLVESE